MLFTFSDEVLSVVSSSTLSSLYQVWSNGKKIIVAKLDLDKFDEDELQEFLSKKRTQKHSASSKEKKSPLEKAHDEELYIVKSDHLRPFSEIAKVF